jgi:hypothetical protein
MAPSTASEKQVDRHVMPVASPAGPDDLLLQARIECNLLSGIQQSPKHLSYSELGDGVIRLIKVQKGSSEDMINCQLQNVHLSQDPNYVALSYTWGSPQKEKTIMVDEYPLLIPKNLYRLLQHIRKSMSLRAHWLWIDMLSIDQANLAERSKQVMMIPQIFGIAKRAVSWLGPAYGGSDDAMIALSKPTDHWLRANRLSRFLATPGGHALYAICRRAYWRRLWIFQELRIGRDKQLMCGLKVVPWSRYRAFMQFIRERLDDATETIRSSPAMRMIELSLQSADTSLWNLMQMTKELRCFDPRDKVFAILGVTTRGHEGIIPDYTIPIPTLLNRVLRKRWELETPDTISEASQQCQLMENIFCLHRGAAYSLDGQRGGHEWSVDFVTQSYRLGPPDSPINLWWTAFHGHTGVQQMLLRSWKYSYFGSVPFDASGRLPAIATVVSLLKICKISIFELVSGTHYLRKAIEKNDGPVLHLLWNCSQHGANLYEIVDHSDLTAWVYHAVESGQMDIVEPLTMRERVSDKAPSLSLCPAAVNALRFLLPGETLGANGQHEKIWAARGIFVASSMGLNRTVRAFLATGLCDLNMTHGGSVYTPERRGQEMTPLMVAAVRGHKSIVDMLLRDPKCKIDTASGHQQTALSLMLGHSDAETRTFSRDELEIMRLLVEVGGADVNIVDPWDRTPLMAALLNENRTLVELFRNAKNCDVDKETPDRRMRPGSNGGMTALTLTLAISRRRSDMAGLLNTHGRGDVNCRNSDRKTPLRMRRAAGHEDIARRLPDTGKCHIPVEYISADTDELIAMAKINRGLSREAFLLERQDKRSSHHTPSDSGDFYTALFMFFMSAIAFVLLYL